VSTEADIAVGVRRPTADRPHAHRDLKHPDEIPGAASIVLADLIDAGKITPVVDRTYPLSETGKAVRYLEEGRARGKVAITI
jgi:NADPH:quinone reductase-like Zn-dependent oxidoreductase